MVSELCQHDGLILQASIYCGIAYDDKFELGQSGAVVLHLMKDSLDKGHKLYMNNYYNSVKLFDVLGITRTHICVTLRKDRKHLPKKRDVYTMSNMHRVMMVLMTNRKGNMKMKPKTARDYNKHMSGIDHADQMLSYNTSLKKSLRWYKEVGVHLLEIYLHHARFLYNKAKSQWEQLTYLEYREKIIQNLVEPRKRVKGERPYAKFHYMQKIPPIEKKMLPTLRCTECWKTGQRHESRFACGLCEDNPVLCVYESRFW